MTELKVQCDCGQRYKFDVEPVNGQMPFTVNCPICRADGTQKANALLQQTAATTVTETLAPPPPPPTAPKLRISSSAPRPPEGGPPPIVPPPIASVTPPPISPLSARPMRVRSVDPTKPVKKPNFWLGLAGGLLGSLVGAAVCFLISFLVVKYLGIRWRFLALWAGAAATGYLAGVAAHVLGRGEGSRELGAIAAIMAIAAIVTAEYFMAVTWWRDTVIATSDSAYGQSVKDAQEALRAMPTGSDGEIRSYLVKQETDDGDDVTTNSITDADIRQFRETQLPELRQLAGGQMTKEQYDAKHGIDGVQEQKDQAATEETFKGVFLLLFLRRSTIVSLCIAAGLAYRISANA